MMKVLFDFLLGFSTIIFAFLGISGIKSFFAGIKEKRTVKKVLKNYEEIDQSMDNRSDLDVLRKL